MEQEQKKMSTKEKRANAEKNLERAKEGRKMIEERIAVKEKLCEAVRSNWDVTDKYKEDAYFKYQLSPEYIEASLEQKELEWEEQFMKLEQQLATFKAQEASAREAIKRNRG